MFNMKSRLHRIKLQNCGWLHQSITKFDAPKYEQQLTMMLSLDWTQPSGTFQGVKVSPIWLHHVWDAQQLANIHLICRFILFLMIHQILNGVENSIFQLPWYAIFFYGVGLVTCSIYMYIIVAAFINIHYSITYFTLLGWKESFHDIDTNNFYAYRYMAVIVLHICWWACIKVNKLLILGLSWTCNLWSAGVWNIENA